MEKSGLNLRKPKLLSKIREDIDIDKKRKEEAELKKQELEEEIK